MSREPIVTNVWTLTIFRSGGYAQESNVENAIFAFGRKTEEIEFHPKQNLPTGIIQILKESNLVDEALESGFVLEICKAKIKSEGWFEFDRIFLSKKHKSCHGTGYWRNRASFGSSIGMGSFEMAPVDWSLSELPQKIWMRAIPLTDCRLAWALGRGDILSSEPNEQSTLEDYFDLGKLNSNRKKINILHLPGPPDSPYHFFTD
jgi:hypothetical protein